MPELLAADLDYSATLHREAMVGDLLVAALDHEDDRTALHLVDGTVSVRELRERVSQFAQAVSMAGVDAASRVTTLSTNRPELVYMIGAELILGYCTSVLHPKGSLEDHLYMLREAEVDTIVFEGGTFDGRVSELLAHLPHLRVLALGPSSIAQDLIEASASYGPVPLVAPNVRPEAYQRIGFTGGTTGKPKGVAHTFRSRTELVRMMSSVWDWPVRPKHLVCAPLTHAASAFVLPVLLHGGSLSIHETFDADAVLTAIERDRITSVMLVPTMIYSLLDHPHLDSFDLSSLEFIYYGASAISPTRLQEALRRIGPVFFQFYGQSESPMALTMLTRAEHDPDDLARLSSCGRPTPWMRVSLLDDDCREVPVGSPGEICARGSLVMAHYYHRPIETAEAFAGDWLHTGDVGIRDADGFITVVDRKKDLIVSGGFNVYPKEVEDALTAHPAVSSVAVFGIPHDKWGEAVMASVVLRPGMSTDADELRRFVRERKGPILTPKEIEFIDSIPLTNVGKHDKKALRARFWELTDRQVN